MREPMSLLDQVNAFNKTNRQHLVIERVIRQRPPVYSSFNHHTNDNDELKSRSFDVYKRKHLVANGKSFASYPERTRLNELRLPTIERDLHHDETSRRRQHRRPFYRKCLFHTYSSTSTEVDLAQISTRGLKHESQNVAEYLRNNNDDDDTTENYRYHLVPPPSPSDNELERLFVKVHEKPLSRSPSQQSTSEKEEDIPFRLPVLRRTGRFRRTPTNSSPQDIRSTLSNYLQRYY